MLNKALLFEMYQAKDQYEVLDIVTRELLADNIAFNIDKSGQVYNLNQNTPLLSSHCDRIEFNNPVTRVTVKNGTVSGNTCLGGDDRNGCFIILELIKKFRNRVSFIFSTNEESGGLDLKKLLSTIGDDVEKCSYALVFDRKGSSDIIGSSNGYCSAEFEDDVSTIGKPFGYKPAIGSWSDADSLSDYINTVNLSCGYYNAHTEAEYSVLAYIDGAYQFGVSLISNIPTDKVWPKPEKDKYNDWFKAGMHMSDEDYSFSAFVEKYKLDNFLEDGDLDENLLWEMYLDEEYDTNEDMLWAD